MIDKAQDFSDQRERILDPAADWQDELASCFAVGASADLATTAQLPAELHPGITVAVCTYQRADSVSRFLDSLSRQSVKPDQLLVVDASPDGETERAVAERADIDQLAGCLLYFRVRGPLQGLTHQRNFALRWAAHELVAFFDDDVVLEPDCLSQMERAFADGDDSVIGVGGYMTNNIQRMDWITRQRMLCRVIPDARPGAYNVCGFSTSWRFLEPGDGAVEGDWLPGFAAMWRTAIARQIGFHTGFEGYSQGEDLDFSLQMRRRGRLLMARQARLAHLHDPAGRPDHYRRGYMLVRNLFDIHRRAHPDRDWRGIAWFAYAWTLDTLFLARHLIFPSRIKQTTQSVLGRAMAAVDILRRREPQ